MDMMHLSLVTSVYHAYNLIALFEVIVKNVAHLLTLLEQINFFFYFLHRCLKQATTKKNSISMVSVHLLEEFFFSDLFYYITLNAHTFYPLLIFPYFSSPFFFSPFVILTHRPDDDQNRNKRWQTDRCRI